MGGIQFNFFQKGKIIDKFLQWLQSLNIPNPPHSIKDLMQRK